ncbi:acetylcholinesterase-like [Amblyomma americanum]
MALVGRFVMARYSRRPQTFATALAVCVIFFHGVHGESTDPIVRTISGPVLGKRIRLGERDVDAFLGIPYAAAPIGDLRFQRPRPVEPWNETYRATEMPSPCWQTTLRFVEGAPLDYFSSASEDCLYVNVWKRSSACLHTGECSSKRPVIFFIHGGGFTWGDSALFVYDPANFVALSDVVFVTFNYRVSVLGFLSLDRPELPGNMGLWDQNLALRWVRANIANFGGDPDEVTLMGQSAGAVSVGLHAVSPQSRDLFKRAVMLSGAPLSMVLGSSHRGEGKFIKLVSDLGCYDVKRTLDDQLPDALSCLRRLDADFIFRTLEDQDPTQRVFVPAFGDEFMPEDPFLEDTWKKLLVKQIVFGNVLNEGTLLLDNIQFASPGLKEILSTDYRLGITVALGPMLGISISQGRRVVEAYFGEPDTEHTNEQVSALFSELLGDAVFDCPVQLMSEVTPEQGIHTYRFVFAHRPSYSFWPEWMGVTHSDEIMYAIGSLPFLNDTSRMIEAMKGESHDMMRMKNYTSEEEKLMEEVVSAFYSFAKVG